MLHIVQILGMTVTCVNVLKQLIDRQLAFKLLSNVVKLSHVFCNNVKL